MYRWLLFRLMFGSGVVKLRSGDPTWRSLTALEYHYETQPLPTWVGYYAHHLPPRAHVFAVAPGRIVGSIGTIASLSDSTAFWEKIGIKPKRFPEMISTFGRALPFSLSERNTSVSSACAAGP